MLQIVWDNRLYFGMVSRHQSNPGSDHWTVVKHILKYLRRTRDYMLVYGREELVPVTPVFSCISNINFV